MVERCAKAMQASPAWPAVFDAGSAQVLARAAIEAYEAANDERPYDPDGPEVTLLHHWFAEHYSPAEWMDDGCRSENARDLLNTLSKAGFIVIPIRSSLKGAEPPPTGFLSTLTPEQRTEALKGFEGDDTLGDPASLKGEGE